MSFEPGAKTLTSDRIIAVVSGKGGSGKTMISAAMGRIVSGFSPTTLVDADTGTAGLTYYLGLKMVENSSTGLIELASKPDRHAVPLQLIHWDKGDQHPFRLSSAADVPLAQFLAVGDHRRLLSEEKRDGIARSIDRAVAELRSKVVGPIIIDCRGGIDRESLAVCSQATDIIIVAEPDTTSFQATQHVVEVLSAKELSHKLRGFFINKVFDDPSVIARNGTAVFKCRCLGAIPFDLEATRDFLVGNIPSVDSQFAAQVWRGLSMILGDSITNRPPRRPWEFEEFSQISLSNPESTRGGLTAAAVVLMFGTGLLLRTQGLATAAFAPEYDRIVTGSLVIAIIFAGLAGAIERSRRALGRMVGAYLDFLLQLTGSRGRR